MAEAFGVAGHLEKDDVKGDRRLSRLIERQEGHMLRRSFFGRSEMNLANDKTHGGTEAAEDCRADRMFLGADIEALGLPRAAADRVRFEGATVFPPPSP